MFSKQSFFMTDTIVSSLLRTLIVQNLWIATFHLFSVSSTSFHIGTCSYLGGMILYIHLISLTITWLFSSLSYALSATTADNGFIFDILVITGLKSILSCLVGARLTLTLQIICFKTSAPMESLAYFFSHFCSIGIMVFWCKCNFESCWIYTSKYVSCTRKEDKRWDYLSKQHDVDSICKFL